MQSKRDITIIMFLSFTFNGIPNHVKTGHGTVSMNNHHRGSPSSHSTAYKLKTGKSEGLVTSITKEDFPIPALV